MMLVTTRPARHLTGFILALSLVLAPAVRPAAAQAADPTGTATFVVLLDGIRVGTESMAVSRAGDEWIFSGSGIIRPPLDLSTMRFEARYGLDWQPRRMTLESALRGTPLAISTSITGSSASNSLTQGGESATNSQDVSPGAVVIPNNFFAAYEALAVRLSGLTEGARLPVYVPPSGETTATINAIVPRRVSVGDQTLEIREYGITIMNSTGAMPAEMWVDDRGRMARLVMPTASLVVIREDLAHVLAREERLEVAGDEDVFIGAAGFVLGATFTKAPGTPDRAPAVILVSGPGPQDRDFLLHGIPLYAHLAQSLSEAGYLVVRYDSRGVGRSGGRAESSRLIEYESDVRSIVEWLRDRDDVDRDRIAVVAFGDTGPIALTAARRTDRIGAVALINSPGRTGQEITLERQQLVLAGTVLSEAERKDRLALQENVIEAVQSGEGWELIPEDIRRQADTPWFESWIDFDPAEMVRRIKRPMLFVHGALDTEVPPAHGQALEALARQRDDVTEAETQLAVIEGVNHLMLPASTGQVDEYATLPKTGLSPEVTSTLVDWLGTVAFVER